MNESRFNILLVEDNDGDIYLFRMALHEAQVAFDLTVIKDGAEALAFVSGKKEYADQRVPDLAVLDLNLPKQEGVEVLAALRQNPRLAAVPVFVTSSSHSPRDQAESARWGIERYLIKPLDFEGFLEIGLILKEFLMRNGTR